MTKTCTNCGAVNQNIAQFCSECGHKLGKGSIRITTLPDQEIGRRNDIDEIRKLYSGKGDDELITILERERKQFTQLALSVAAQELIQRGYEIIEDNGKPPADEPSRPSGEESEFRPDRGMDEHDDGRQLFWIIVVVLIIVLVMILTVSH
jgi:hypothetical protein